MEKIIYRFEEVNTRKIIESPMNAQVMTDSDFNRLVENLKKDKILTSSVLLMETESGKLMCISGHHRIKAAIKANISKVPALIINEVDESTRVRLQLTHNDIHGTPDNNIIAILQKKLSEHDIKLVEWQDIEVVYSKEIDANIEEFKYVSICLKPDSYEELLRLINSMADNADAKMIIEKEEYELMKDALTKAHKKGYKTPGKAFRKFIDIVNENI